QVASSDEAVHAREVGAAQEISHVRWSLIADSIEAPVRLSLVERFHPGAHVGDPLADVASELELSVVAQGPRAGQGRLGPGARELALGDGQADQLGRELETLLRPGLAKEIARGNDSLHQRAGRLHAAREQSKGKRGYAGGRADQ